MELSPAITIASVAVWMMIKEQNKRFCMDRGSVIVDHWHSGTDRRETITGEQLRRNEVILTSELGLYLF